MQAAAAQSASVVRFPVKRARKVTPAMDAPPGLLKPWPTAAERLARERAAAEKLIQLLIDLEAPPIDEPARLKLQRLIYWFGLEHVTLLTRKRFSHIEFFSV
jgi:hypothetical protein